VVACLNLPACNAPEVTSYESYKLAEEKANELSELAKDGVSESERESFDRTKGEFEALLESLRSELKEAQDEVSKGVEFVKEQGKPFVPAPISGAVDGLVGLGLSLFFALRGDKRQQVQLDELARRVKAVAEQ